MAGLLNTLKKNWRGLLDEVQAAPESLRALTQPAAAQQFDAALRNGGTIDKEKAVQMAMDVLQTTPMGVMGKIVYHGSPHKFDKFDMSKIGTGEGAQAYGHGLYMAESPEVAKTYGMVDIGKNKEFRSVTYGGQTYPQSDPMAHSLFEAASQGRAPVIQKLQAQADRLSSINPAMAKKLEEKIAFLKTVNPDKVQIEAGNMYKVDIPDEAVSRMLDWNKPLSEQGIFSVFSGDNIAKARPNMTGRELYESVTRNAPDAFGLNGKSAQQVAAEYLDEKGIPGIRYLDQDSRAAGGGTSNFVLFDDQLPRILERNGIPTGLNPWAPGEWRGLLEP